MTVEYSDIKAVQIIVGNYADYIRNQTVTTGDELDQWREYQSLTLEGFTYDGKLIPYGGTFIPFISGIQVQSGSEFRVTGNYSVYTTWLPTPNYTPYIFDIENMGIQGVNGMIPDGVYWVTYSTYVNTDPNPLTICLDSIQYIVYGTSGTAQTGGNMYRIGEVFISDGNNAVTFTGDASLKVLSGITFKYFNCTYQIQKRLSDLQVYLYRTNSMNLEFTNRINTMYSKLQGVNLASIQNYTSAGTTQEIINDITSELNEIDLLLG